MKKLFLLCASMLLAASAFAQTLSVDNFEREMPCLNEIGQVIAEKMGTIMLPYVPKVEGGKLYELISATPDKFVFQQVMDPKANTPYVFRVDEGYSQVKFEGSGEASTEKTYTTAAAGVEDAFVGSYQRVVIYKTKLYYLSNDKINCNNGAAVATTPCRAYFTADILPADAVLSDNVELVFVDRAENGITRVASESAEDAAVVINRQNVSLDKGAYKINGKKAVVK